MSFDVFTSRLTIRGRLIAQTGLHIGTGSALLDPAATDSPVIRDAARRPFIPGSSFKGALRAHLERLVRSVSRQGFDSCDPLVDPCIPNTTHNGKIGIAEIKAEAEDEATTARRLDRALYDTLLTQKILQHSCIVCRLFGSPWLAAHVLIKDVFVDDTWQAQKLELRDGVGIDRDTETARQGIKYDFEVVPATTCFTVEIVVENAEDDILGLLAIGLRELEQERVALGGKTTRGLGGVKLELTEMEVVGDTTAEELEGTGSTDLLTYLIDGQGKLLQGEILRDYLEGKRRALVNARLQ